jgi:hypothetical protein
MVERRKTMTQVKILVATTAVAFTLVGAAALAQQPAHPPGAGQQPSASAQNPWMSGEGHGGAHAQHMEICRQMMAQGGMMGGSMGPGMVGGGMMPMMMSGDPKQQAEMMAMRGEMMKAMGDIMIKYAQRMQSGK